MLRLGVQPLVQLLTFSEVRRFFRRGKSGSDQILVNLSQLGLIRVHIIKNGAVDLVPF
jgi:hypothetical protein